MPPLSQLLRATPPPFRRQAPKRLPGKASRRRAALPGLHESVRAARFGRLQQELRGGARPEAADERGAGRVSPLRCLRLLLRAAVRALELWRLRGAHLQRQLRDRRSRLQARPAGGERRICSSNSSAPPKPKHLDYGGGSGVLSDRAAREGLGFAHLRSLRRSGASGSASSAASISSPPSRCSSTFPTSRPCSPTCRRWSEPDGLIVFSTLLSDGEIVRGRPLTLVVRGAAQRPHQPVFRPEPAPQPQPARLQPGQRLTPTCISPTAACRRGRVISWWVLDWSSFPGV